MDDLIGAGESSRGFRAMYCGEQVNHCLEKAQDSIWKDGDDIGPQNQRKNTFLVLYLSPTSVSQNLNAHLGSVHRIHIPREIPSRNSGARSYTSFVRWQVMKVHFCPTSVQLCKPLKCQCRCRFFKPLTNIWSLARLFVPSPLSRRSIENQSRAFVLRMGSYLQ